MTSFGAYLAAYQASQLASFRSRLLQDLQPSLVKTQRDQDGQDERPVAPGLRHEQGSIVPAGRFDALPVYLLRYMLTGPMAMVNPGLLAAVSTALRRDVAAAMNMGLFWRDLSLECFPGMPTLAPDSQRLLAQGRYGPPASPNAQNAAWRAHYHRVLAFWDVLRCNVTLGRDMVDMPVKAPIFRADTRLITCAAYTAVAETQRTVFHGSPWLSRSIRFSFSIDGAGMNVHAAAPATGTSSISIGQAVRITAMRQAHVAPRLSVRTAPGELTIDDLQWAALPVVTTFPPPPADLPSVTVKVSFVNEGSYTFAVKADATVEDAIRELTNRSSHARMAHLVFSGTAVGTFKIWLSTTRNRARWSFYMADLIAEGQSYVLILVVG